MQCLRDLAECYECLQVPARAVPLYRELAESWKRNSGPESREFAESLNSLGRTLLLLGKPSEANHVLRESLDIKERKESDEWTTFDTRSMLGGALLFEKKYADAEPLLVQGYEGMKQRETRIPKNGKARLIEAAERLVQLYAAWGKPAEAVRWFSELETLPKPETKPATATAAKAGDRKP